MARRPVSTTALRALTQSLPPCSDVSDEACGSGYIYTREAFGNSIGFEVGWMTWLARIASIASLSNGFAQASTFISPAAGSGLPRVLLITIPLLFFTWINVVGVKHGARLAVGLTIAKVVPLTLIYTLVQLVASWRLFDATTEQRARYEIFGDGTGIRWPDFDEDLSVRGMLEGVPARRPPR